MDFCFTFKGQGSQSMQEWLDERGLDQRNCGLVNVPNIPNIYGVYYDWGQHIRLAGITKEYFIDYENYSKNLFLKTIFHYYDHNDWENYEDIMENIWENHSTPFGGYCGIISPDGDSNTIQRKILQSALCLTMVMHMQPIAENTKSMKSGRITGILPGMNPIWRENCPVMPI